MLLLLMHHIAADGWSLSPLLRDLWAVVRGALRGCGGGACLRCRCNMRTTRCGSRRCWVGERGAKADLGQLGYWRDQLAELPEQLELPRERVRPAVSSHRGAGLRWSCRRSCTAACSALARASGRACSWCCRRRCGCAERGWGGQLTSRWARRLRGAPTSAGRSGRVLRQHAGAAHGHLGQSELPRAARRG